MNVSDKKENSGFKLAQPVKSSMVEKEIWGSILAYTKNHLVYLSDDKKLSSGAGIISWNFLKKKKKKKRKQVIFTTVNWNCVKACVQRIDALDSNDVGWNYSR